MSETILLGRGETIIGIDAKHWRAHLTQAQQHGSKRLEFMTEDHRRVRNFVVSELPRNGGRPLSAQEIATRLDLPLASVFTLLDDLQQRLFFLVQNEKREVCWAFPVASDVTPHRLTLSSGERIFGA